MSDVSIAVTGDTISLSVADSAPSISVANDAVGLSIVNDAVSLTIDSPAPVLSIVNDAIVLSIETTRVDLSIAAIQGPAGPPGPTGPAGTGDLHYTHTQSVPSATWNVAHNLGKFPTVSIVDSAGSLWISDVRYIDLNLLTISFSAAFGGLAYLN